MLLGNFYIMTISHDLVQFYSNRCHIGDAPPSRVSAPGQLCALEKSIREYAEKQVN